MGRGGSGSGQAWGRIEGDVLLVPSLNYLDFEQCITHVLFYKEGDVDSH